MVTRSFAWITALLVTVGMAAAEPPSTVAVPTPLEPWRGWVLHGLTDLGSPSPYDDAACRIRAWPSALDLTVTPTGATWRLRVRTFAAGWLPLPGGGHLWPIDVTLDNAAVAVVEHDGVPSIELTSGEHAVSGRFIWPAMPEQIAVPATIGIVALTLDGEPVAIPDRAATGAVWLRRSRAAAEEADLVTLQVHRVLEDGLPLWLRTEVELTVSGKSREEEFGSVLPGGWLLSYVDSPIPVAVDATGRLRAQVRAGTWRIRLDAFRTADTREIAYAADTPPAAAEELVALKAWPQFRATEFENAAPVDVQFTTLPEAWRNLPIFRWDTREPLRWTVKASGGGLTRPDRFQMSRRLWLDDDGGGLTCEDTITGECRALSRIDAAEGHHLEVVRINGERQLITRNPRTSAEGVEIRLPTPTVQSIGRMERLPRLPATGWQSAADALQLDLSLPPGWRMLALFGADGVDGDWLTAWTLLDLFLLLVFSMGVFRMRGLAAGLLAFIAFGLAYHEALSPRFTWLFLLAPTALLGAVRAPRLAWWLRAWWMFALALLLLHLVPFVAGELQAAIFPQLDPTGMHYRQRDLMEIFTGPRMRDANRRLGDVADLEAARAPAASSSLGYTVNGRATMKQHAMESRAGELTSNLKLAPGTQTQTGIAKPAWSGNHVVCTWDGPVSPGQMIRMVLMPAWLHRVVAVVRVALLAGLLGAVLRGRRITIPRGVASSAATLLVILGGLITTAPAVADDLPDAKLLDQLRERLTAPDDAFPHAAEIPAASLVLDGRRIELDATIHAAADCAVPVPGKLPSWSPVSVALDGTPAAVCRRDDGFLWVWVPAGVHRLTAAGMIPEAPEWVWTHQLTPRRLAVKAGDWTVTGLRADGTPEKQLFFVRTKQAAEGAVAYDQKNVRSVVQVDRVLEIGLVWKVHTTVRRLVMPGRAITLRVPLLPGERVLSGRGDDTGDTIEVTLSSTADAMHWESELPIAAAVQLDSKAGSQWVERWSLVTSPVWNVTSDGLAPVYEPDADTLKPVWYPWPGESVTLTIERPEAVDGRTLTVKSARRAVDLGSRRRTGSLTLLVESSLGGDFSIGLPEQSVIREVKVDDRSLPVRRSGGEVLVGLQPGSQSVAIDWSTDMPLASRAAIEPLTLPVEVANLTTTMSVPESRWILWAHGPLRGPAVRFWAVLALAVVLAVALGRVPASPLSTREWLFLMVGLTQVSFLAGGIVVGWLFCMAWRGRRDPRSMGWFSFDLLQLFLVGLTVAAMIVLVVVVSRGLLGQPVMFVAGNGSYANELAWFEPNAGASPASPWVFTVSLWYYRLLMLLWGLWLANAVIRWLITGWGHLTAGGGWRWWRDRRLASGSSPPPLSV